MADLTLRSVKGSPLTNAELDGNFEYFTGSHAITGSLTVTQYVVLPTVSSSLEFVNDAAAAAAGVPLGGLYRNGSFIQIRLV
jgi:hypothetical protein